jgi:uncharacterized protein involved in outer membrane biogenesis
MRNVLIGIAIVVAIIAIIIGYIVTFADLSEYRTDVEEAIKEATGRDLRIEGDFDLQLLPPSITVGEVYFANTEWGSDSPMLTVGYASASIDGSSLFGDQIVIENFELRDVEVVLEENEAGENNWSIEPQETVVVGVQVDESDEVPVVLQSAVLRNITVIRRRPGVEESSVTLSSLNVQSDGTRYRFEGSATPLDEIGAMLGAEDLPGGPVSASGEVIIDGNNLGLIDVRLQAADLVVGTTLNAVITGEAIDLDPFAITVGESDLSGTLNLGLAEPLRVSGSIRSKKLDLTPYAKPYEAEAEPAPAPANDGYVLSEEPLPFDFLTAGSVDLQILIESFRNGPIQLEQVKGTIGLEDGRLDITSGLAVAEGGNAEATISLAAAGDSADLDVNFDLTGFRLNTIESDGRAVADIPLIGLSADIEATGTSVHALASSANGKILFTQGAGKVDNSAMGLFSADIVSELFSALNPFAKEEPFSIWECTVVGMDVVDGVATIKPLLAQSQKLTIVADGKVDFNDEQLDVSFNTKPRRGVGVSADMFLTPFIRLGGTMAAPRMALDKSGILIEGGAAFLTGGISFFVKGAADRATGASDRCAAALAIANGEVVEPAE